MSGHPSLLYIYGNTAKIAFMAAPNKIVGICVDLPAVAQGRHLRGRTIIAAFTEGESKSKSKAGIAILLMRSPIAFFCKSHPPWRSRIVWDYWYYVRT